VSDAPLTVLLEREVQVDASSIVVGLTFKNDGPQPVLIKVKDLKVGTPTSKAPLRKERIEGVDSSFVVLPGRSILDNIMRVGNVVKESDLLEHFVFVAERSSVVVFLRGDLVQSDTLAVYFEQGIFDLEGAIYEVAPLTIVSPEMPLVDSRPSMMHIGVRAAGGIAVGPAQPAPLTVTPWVLAGWSGIFEGFIGLWTRSFEVQVILRPGFGRVIGLEAGVRPGPSWLTLYGSYGFDGYQFLAPALGSGQPVLGHGPRFSVDFAFDRPVMALGVARPGRFGVFVTAGVSFLRNSIVPEGLLIPVFEGGLRWRLH
jgi:hypothetical protein